MGLSCHRTACSASENESLVDPNLYRLSVDRFAPLYLKRSIPEIEKYHLQVFDGYLEFVEQNFPSKFLSAELIDHEAKERIEAVIQPNLSLGQVDQRFLEEDPFA